MKFDLTNKSVDELVERQQLLSAEIPAEERDAMTAEEIEERGDELEAIKAELETREAAAKAAEETRQEVAEGNDPIIKTFEEKVEEKHMEKNSMEYRNLWLKNLQGTLTEEETRAYAAADDANAVPQIVSDKFFEKMKKLAPMLSEITLLRVAGNLKFVAEGVRNTASKHTENSAIDAAADTVVNVTLGGFEFMKVIQISRTAKLMSVDAFEGWLVEMLAGDIARAIDNYIINDVTNGIAALTWTTSTNQIVAANYAYGSVCDLIALLPAAYDAEAKFLVNKKTLYGQIAQIEDSQNRPI
ncbi:MAG: phage major capsid protein, partial [Lentisphaeria bacterium]|nr:phage major capsid protein [Lentisphaeria bacterium]